MKLVAQRLSVARGGHPILHDLDLYLRPGEITLVIGPNGAGKSTLIRALAGLIPAHGVTLDDVDVHAMAPRQRAQRLGVFLEPPDATFGFTARELVVMGRFPHLGTTFESQDDRRRADDALDALEVAHLADRPYARLSSGERQRVGIARLVCQDTDVALLDEPTSRLDPYHALRVAELLRTLARKDRIVLAAEHDLDLAAQLADRLIILVAGRIVADGPPADVLTPERIAEVYRVRARRVDHDRASIVIDRAE